MKTSPRGRSFMRRRDAPHFRSLAFPLPRTKSTAYEYCYDEKYGMPATKARIGGLHKKCNTHCL